MIGFMLFLDQYVECDFTNKILTWQSPEISRHMPLLHQLRNRSCVFRFIPLLHMGTSLTQRVISFKEYALRMR
jgi:hypothetical protein